MSENNGAGGIPALKPSLLKLALRAALPSKRPVHVSGPPGVGKSQIARQVAEAAGFQFQDLRTTLLDPVDLRGLPSVSKAGLTKWNPPDFLPRDGKVLLFLDELPNAPQAVQSALLQLVLDRGLGDYRLPDDAVVWSAGNRVQDRAGASRLISSLADRFIHLGLEPDPGEWCQWAVSHRIRPEVLAFIRFRPECLSDFDPHRQINATPRSWEYVSDLLPTLPAEVELEMLSGIVGEGAAAEFSGFLRIARQIPDPDAVLMNPAQAPIPDDPATLWALCGALGYRAGEATAPRLIEYAERLNAAEHQEFMIVLIRDCQQAEGFCNTAAYIKWATDYQDLLT